MLIINIFSDLSKLVSAELYFMTYLTNGFFILAQVPQTRTLTVDAQNGNLISRTLLDSRQTSFYFKLNLYIFLFFIRNCVFPTVVVSMLPHAEFGQNEHREDASRFIFSRVM